MPVVVDSLLSWVAVDEITFTAEMVLDTRCALHSSILSPHDVARAPIRMSLVANESLSVVVPIALSVKENAVIIPCKSKTSTFWVLLPNAADAAVLREDELSYMEASTRARTGLKQSVWDP